VNWICAEAKLTTPLADASIWHGIFEQFGCGGTVEQASPPTISAYLFEDATANETIASLGKALLDAGAAEVTFNRVSEEDWAETWKQFFKAREVGKRLLIKPSWEDVEPGDRLVIELDPGQAFGTGEHPTTRLCLELIEEVFLTPEPETQTPKPETTKPKTVADIGCGSGVLSIAAAKLGAIRLFATEIDPAAAEAARANFLRNRVEVDLRTTGDIPAEPGFDIVSAEPGFDVVVSAEFGFDLVVSNIISAVLIKLAPDIARITNPGGLWLLSGVIEANWGDVEDAATRAGFDLVSKREEEGWIAAVLRRR
jgi:ribosomal protein L11 methyltransferase